MDIEKLTYICNLVSKALIENDFEKLHSYNALIRVEQTDLIRVLNEYGSRLTPIPQSAYKCDSFNVYYYNDGSGCKIDLNLWIDGQESDLILQLDIRINTLTGEPNHFNILDLLVM